MNETLKVLETRRSCRNFKPDMISREELQEILKAGTYAPTGMGKQSPIVIAVTDKELRDELAAATEITVSDDKKTVTYDNPKTGSSTIFLDNGRYKIRTYLDLDTSDQNPARPLVSDAAKTASLKLNPEPAITYDPVKGLITISAFGIESSKTNSKVAELRQPYKIKVLVPKDS